MSLDIFESMFLDVSIYFYVYASNISEYLWILGIIDIWMSEDVYELQLRTIHINMDQLLLVSELYSDLNSNP